MMIINSYINLAIRLALFVLSLVIFCMLGADFAYAQGVESIIESCPDHAENNRIFTPIMMCMTDVVDAVSQSYLAEVVDAVRDVVTSCMALAIALLASRVALGASNEPMAESFVLIMKICAISFFVFNSGVTEYIGYLRGFTEALSDKLINVLKSDEVFTVVGDKVNSSGSGSSESVTVSPPGGTEMWHQIDFLFQRVLGMEGEDTNLGQGMVGLFMVLTGLFTIGPMGGWAGVFALYAVVTLMGAFAMIIFSFMASMIAIMFLGAISPIVIPTILFSPTKTLFDNWLKQLVSYAMQPVILTAFIVFMLTVMENGAVDMLTQYNKAMQTVESPNEKNSVPFISLPENRVKTSKPGIKDRESHGRLTLRVVGGESVMETGENKDRGGGSARVDLPFLAFNKDDIKEFTFNFILMLFLSVVMMNFVAHLPSMVNELMGDRSIPNLVDRFGKPVFASAMRGQSSLTNYLSK